MDLWSVPVQRTELSDAGKLVRARSSATRHAVQHHGDRAGGAKSGPCDLFPATGNAQQFLRCVRADRLEVFAELEAHHRIAVYLRHSQRRRAISRTLLWIAGLFG